MKKAHFFIGIFYATLLGASLSLAGCDTMQDLWGNNNKPYYSKSHAYPNDNKTAPRAEKNIHKTGKAEDTITTAHPSYATHTSAAKSATPSSTSTRYVAPNYVAPKASSTASSALDSPIMPTTTPAVDQ